MGRRGHHSAAKRQRDRAQQEKKARKRARKQMRGSDDGSLSTDEYAAPPVKGGTDDEIQAAIERAMNPGKHRARVARSGGATETRLFVGNLDFAATEQDLKDLFASSGYNVIDARIVTDRATGESRGFAFVGLSAADDARQAISDLDGAQLNGRPLRINPADQKRR